MIFGLAMYMIRSELEERKAYDSRELESSPMRRSFFELCQVKHAFDTCKTIMSSQALNLFLLNLAILYSAALSPHCVSATTVSQNNLDSFCAIGRAAAVLYCASIPLAHESPILLLISHCSYRLIDTASRRRPKDFLCHWDGPKHPLSIGCAVLGDDTKDRYQPRPAFSALSS